MRVALIADIHGNLTALDAVLAELGAEQIDQLVCLGDVAATGPQPREVILRLRALGCPVVMGNADAALLDAPVPSSHDDTAQRIADIDSWAAAQLSSEDKRYVRAFTPTVTVPLSGDEVLLCYHGSPRSFGDRLLPSTAVATLDRWLAGYPALLYAGGHTHAQMLIRHRQALVLNPGSVGLPFTTIPPDAGTRNPAWAEYAVVTGGTESLCVELRRTPFDVGVLLAAARANGMPHADWWASDWEAAARPATGA
jgi:predicted phosphodiesterase